MGTSVSSKKSYEYEKKDNYEKKSYNSSSSEKSYSSEKSSSSSSIKQGRDYDDWKAEKEAQGLRLTTTGKNEADFALYFSAVSDEVKTAICDSFDCEQDYQLQAEIAAEFGKHNFLHRDDIYKMCKAKGWSIERVDYASSIIHDFKGGNFTNAITENGTVYTYTISDGKGGSIMIADANGNGGLEIEEIYGNELLSGVVSDIKPGEPTLNLGSGRANGSSGENGVNGPEDSNAPDKNNGKVTQAEFNATVEKYIQKGYATPIAIAEAKAALQVNDLKYTGEPKITEIDE